MRARPGDRLVLAAPHTSEATRDGEVLEARGPDGGPPFLIRWEDGHEGLFYPGPGALLRVGSDTPDEAPATAPVAPPAQTRDPVREWQVRVSIFERGDETDANVVLFSDAPQHLTASGHTRRSTSDIQVPEIGDEVAVARALRRLADLLLETAAGNVAYFTGEEHVRLKA